MGRKRSGEKAYHNKAYWRNQKRFYQNAPWYIYTAALDLEGPFYLELLQRSILNKLGNRIKIKKILEEIREFKKETGISLLNHIESDDQYTINTDIDLNVEPYKILIREPKEGRGRPGVRPAEDPEYRKRYGRNFRRITRKPERYLEKIFLQERNNSVADIVNQFTDMAEGVVFGTSFVERLLDEYIANFTGPPFLRKVEPGMYRRVVKRTALKYVS